MKKIRFIANPFSGNNRKRNLHRLIEENLDLERYQYELCYTEYAGHARKLAAEAADQNYYMVVACGGDGSVNEVAGSLVHTSTAMGVLPCGSGNGFAEHLGMGRNVAKAITYLNTGKLIRIDTAQLNNLTFVNLAGIGFDAVVAKRFRESRVRGFVGYFLYTLTETFNYRMLDVEIELDEQTIQRSCLLVEVANAPIYGYGFSIVPPAKFNDGRLEVLIVNKAPKWRYLLESWRLLNRSFHLSPLVECYTCKRVVLHPKGPAAFHLDGEGYDLSGIADIRIVPKSLLVMAPRAYAQNFLQTKTAPAISPN